jgi:hypothetical protein
VAAVLLACSGCGGETLERIGLSAPGRPATTTTSTPDEVAMVVTDLQDCDVVSALEPDAGREPSISVGLDQSVMAGLAEYGQANPASFGGLWLDGRYGATPVIALTGDPEAHLDGLGSVVPDRQGLAPYILVTARYTQSELTATADRLLAGRPEIDSLWSATVDTSRNRVVVGLLDPADAELELLGDSLPLDQVCIEVTAGPSAADGPLRILPRPGRDRLLSCGGPSFPQSALERPVSVTETDHPAARQFLTFIGGSEAADGWIVLDDGGDRVLFGRYRGSGLEVDTTAEATASAGGWEVAGWVFGCELRVGLPRGLGSVQIFTDPARPPRPGDRTLRVLVSELACAGGREMGSRLRGPEVAESSGLVTLAFAVVALPEGDGSCPDNPLTPVSIELDEPLGARSIVDGMFLPPRALSPAP